MQASAGAVTRQRLMSADARAPLDRYEAWQTEIDTYDEWGPGFVGSYLDLVADKVSRCDGVLYDTRSMSQETDPRIVNIFNGVWSLWRGPYNNRVDLLKRHARLRTKHGECFILRLPNNTGMVVAHKNELKWESGKGLVHYRDPITEKWIPVTIDAQGPIPNIWRSWAELDRDPRLAHSDLKRALVHVREYINVKLRQDSDTVSPLVRNKIIMFGDGTETYKNPDDANDPKNGLPDAFVDYLNLAARREKQQYHQPRRPQDTIPFPMIGPDLNVVDLGRNTDPRSEKLEDSAIYAFARSVRVPVQYIHSGPGVAKYDNEDFVLESLIQDAVEPIAFSMLGDIWRVWARPLMIIAYSHMMQVSIPEAEYAMRHYTIGPDTDRIRPKIDNVKNLSEGYRAGAVSRLELASSMDSTPLELPYGMTEFEFWLLLNKIPSGQLTDASPGMPSWFVNPSPGGAAQVAQLNPAATPQQIIAERHASLPAPAPQIAAAAAPITAAPTLVDSRSRFAHVVSHANETDKRLIIALTAHAQSGYARIIDEAARNLSRLAPTGSSLKKRLASVSSSVEKLAQLTPEDVTKFEITPEKLIPDDAASHIAAAAKRTLETTLSTFVLYSLGQQAFASDATPEYDTERGAERLADGVLRYARYMTLGEDGTTPRVPDPSADIPRYHVRDALALTGGAQENDTSWGLQHRIDAAGAPVITGAAAGIATRNAIAQVDEDAASSMYFNWSHGFFHSPTNPSETHLMLDGTRARIQGHELRSDAPPDVYPGDHPGCTCAWILELS